jgi:hypothetical protein
LYVSFPNATRGFEPISCRGALLNTLLHITVYVYTQYAECTGTDCKQNEKPNPFGRTRPWGSLSL